MEIIGQCTKNTGNENWKKGPADSQTNACKYLGIKMDYQLRLAQHLKTVVNQTRASTALIYPVLSSKLPLSTRLSMYKTYIRTCLTYAASACYQLLSMKSKKTTEAQQSKSLSIIVNSPIFVKTP